MHRTVERSAGASFGDGIGGFGGGFGWQFMKPGVSEPGVSQSLNFASLDGFCDPRRTEKTISSRNGSEKIFRQCQDKLAHGTASGGTS